MNDIEKEFFENNGLDIYSRWQVTDNIQHILPPLSIDKDLMMLKIKDGNYTKVDFRIIKIESSLFFHELLSNNKYWFDISDINLDKIYFYVIEGKGTIWTRLSLNTFDDLMQYYS